LLLKKVTIISILKHKNSGLKYPLSEVVGNTCMANE
jgi:hypothetical protein